MKVIINIVLVILCTACVYMDSLGASPSGSSTEGIRRLLHFGGKILESSVSSDLGSEVSRDAVIGEWKYSSPAHNEFAPLMICLAKQGTFVNDNLRAKASTFGFVAFSNKAAGYSSSMFGPGGSETVVWLTIPHRRVDLAIHLMVPGDPPLDSTGDNDDYLDFLGGEGDVLLNRLVDCAILVMENHNVVNPATNTASSIIPPSPEVAQDQAPRPAVIISMSKSNQAPRALAQDASSPVEASTLETLDTPLLYIILLIIIVLLVGVCVRKYAGRKRPL